MAASVRIEASAFADPRIDLLGELAGYNRHEALGRMALLWSVCTDRETSILDVTLVRSCMGLAGVGALVDAGLGELVDSANIRVKGTDGRIDWLADHRARSAAGGKARAAGAPRAGGRFVASQAPAGAGDETSHSPGVSSPLTLTLPLALSTQPPKEVVVSASAKRRRATQLPVGWEPEERATALAGELGFGADVVRAEAAHFRDWAMAKGQAFVDWDRAFANWLRNSNRFNGNRAPAKPRDVAADLWAKADALEAKGE